MPKKCLICKAEPSPICQRSFHMFPKNETTKQKWLDAINVSNTPNFKTAYICSDHFDAESFFYTDELRQRKRLCKEAVPKKRNVNSLNLPRENETKENAIIGINYCQVSDVTEDISLEANTNEPEICTDAVTLTNNSLEFHKSNVLEDGSSQSHSKERKRTFHDTRTAERVRFMDGFKSQYLCREDFVSEETWNRFLRYSAYQRSRIAAAHNKNSRKKKKIKNLTGVIDTLEKREQFDAAEYLKKNNSEDVEISNVVATKILEQELFMDHRHQLILLIIQKYIDIRLKHEGKLLQDQNQRIRMQNNKLTIFKGQ